MARNRLPFFIVGVGIGAASGLLLAPKRGEDTRADLAGAVRDGCDFVAETSDGLRAAAVDAVDRSRQMARSQRGLLQSALDAGMRAYHLVDREPT